MGLTCRHRLVISRPRLPLSPPLPPRYQKQLQLKWERCYPQQQQKKYHHHHQQ
jgi:hypothetical protein